MQIRTERETDLMALPRREFTVEPREAVGSLETWRHSVGVGGVNSDPLPYAVVEQIRSLRPRLVRIFIQEFFGLKPPPEVSDWSKLDGYMTSVGDLGGAVVACLSMKPPALYPVVDHQIWRPNDMGRWQDLVRAVVYRYSVERRLVTHWEVGNETNIGERGGCPFLIQDPADYWEFYSATTEAIVSVQADLRVGGPALAGEPTQQPLPGFVDLCRQRGTRLDFVSWHLYDGDPRRHGAAIEEAKRLTAGLDPRPELMVTEWNKAFPPVSVEDLADDPGSAAQVAAVIIAMLDKGLDWSFYYHVCDMACDPAEFRSFFSEAGIRGMTAHWNEVPHRMGLVDPEGRRRPSYYLLQMLAELGSERVAVDGAEDIAVLAGRQEDDCALLLANWQMGNPAVVVSITFSDAGQGNRVLRVVRLDDGSNERISDNGELMPLEERRVVVDGEFRCQVLLPSSSVMLLSLRR